MRILLAAPGHLKTVPMGGYAAAALARLGHEVVAFDSRPGWREKLRLAVTRRHGAAAPLVSARLLAAAERARPDLVLAVFGFDLTAEALATLRSRGVASACWWLNDPFQLPRSLRQAAGYDAYFTNARGCLSAYREAGVHQARFLPHAIEPTVHRRVELPGAEAARYASEVCFAGDWSPLREEWVGRLLSRYQVRVWGPWGKKLAAGSPIRGVLTDGFFTPGEMVKAFAGAKVVLNLHTWFGQWPYGINPRLFEAAGAGACQVVDRKVEIPDLYRVPEEVACFETPEELERLLDHYLTAEAERRAMGQAAAARSLREHTYDARMRELLAAMGL